MIALNEYVSIVLHRTLRIPDDGGEYPLPPSLGQFPVHAAATLPGGRAAWRDRDYVVPIHQREALWLGFSAPHWRPHLLKVGVGGIDAISGKTFDPGARHRKDQDYCVVPEQPWLDGINAGDGFIRQFVAARLGEGVTVEAQLTGQEDEGGLTLALFEPREGRFPTRPPLQRTAPAGPPCVAAMPACAAAPMGLGAGGRMRQVIDPDVHAKGTFKKRPARIVTIELVDAVDFAARTGLPVPPTPVDAATYTAHGLPWFDRYDPVRRDVRPSRRLAGVRSVNELTGVQDAPIRIEPGQVVQYA